MTSAHTSISKQQRLQEANKVTWYGLILNIVLTVFKFFAGVSGHSGAMLADAVHSLSDIFTDIVTFVGVAMGAKPDSKKYNYGHGKFETMASLIISAFLMAVAIGICIKSMSSIILVANGGTMESPRIIALIAAAVSIISKELIYQITMRTAKRINSTALKANAWHHRSDAFSSIGVLIGIAGAMLLGNDFTILDPIAAIVVSIFIARMAIKLGWTATCELMERSLPEDMEKQIKQIVESVDGLENMHNLRTRRIGACIAIDTHIWVTPCMTVKEAHEKVELSEIRLRKTFGEDTYINIHIEPIGE